jgi:hypothetical protein
MRRAPLQLLTAALAVAALTLLSGCFAGQLLRDMQMEEQLLKPGALDPRLDTFYRTYSYGFLGRFRISHEWPTRADPCVYGGRYAKDTTSPSGYSRTKTGDFYEANGSTLQTHEGTGGLRPENQFLNMDLYVRGLVPGTKPPVYGRPYPICDQAWVASNHYLSVYLTKRTQADWEAAQQRPGAQFSYEQIGSNRWRVQREPLQPRKFNSISGPFELWALPIADTGYTIAIRMGANLDSLQQPAEHAKMLEVFRHLIESVKVDPF